MSEEVKAAAQRVQAVLEDKALMLPSGPPSEFDKDVAILCDACLGAADRPRADEGTVWAAIRSELQWVRSDMANAIEAKRYEEESAHLDQIARTLAAAVVKKLTPPE